MNSQNNKNEPANKHLDLLSEQEQKDMNQHLNDDPSCQEHSPRLKAAYAVLGKSEEADEGSRLASIWSGIQADIENKKSYEPLFSESPAPSNLVIALSCSYCHGPLPRAEACYCASCLAPHHEDCFQSYGRCTSMGCEETHTVKPQLQQAPRPKSSRKRSHTGVVALIVTAPLLVVGLTAGVGYNRYSATKQAIMAEERARKAQALAEAQAREKPLQVTVVQDEPPLEQIINGSMKTKEVGPLIDIEVVNVELPRAIAIIAQQAKQNILVSPEIKEKVTIKLKQLAWRDAVELIAKLTHCEVESPAPNVLMLTQPPKVTIQFNDANIRTVLQLLAAYSGKNIIIANDISGSVTVDFKETRWDVALDALVRVNKLHAQQNKDIVIVSKSPFKRKWGLKLGEEEGKALRPAKKININKTATLTEFVQLLNEVSTKPIVLKQASHQKLTVKLNQVPWNTALKIITKQSQYEVIETEKQFTVLPIKKNFFVAKNAPCSPWMQCLGALADKNIATQSNMAEFVTLDLHKVSARAALEVTAHNLDLSLEEKTGIITAWPRVKRQKLSKKKKSKATVITVDGQKYALILQAALGNHSKKCAIISGQIYSEGQTLLSDDEELPLRVAKISARGVTLSVYEDDSEKATKTVTLNFPSN